MYVVYVVIKLSYMLVCFQKLVQLMSEILTRLVAATSEEKEVDCFNSTSKFYPSRRSSKMIAAMKTNKTHTYTHTQSQIRHTQRKIEKNDKFDL